MQRTGCLWDKEDPGFMVGRGWSPMPRARCPLRSGEASALWRKDRGGCHLRLQ